MTNVAKRSDVVQPKVVPFFDDDTNTFSYVVRGPTSNACAIIDSVLEFDMANGNVDRVGADSIIRYVEKEGLEVEWIIETHVHADHLTAAPYLKNHLGGKIAIGDKVSLVQEVFGPIFNVEKEFRADGSQFDHLFVDGEEYTIGNLQAYAMHTPGHTPGSQCFRVRDTLVSGDTLFINGCGRVDLPGSDVEDMYYSIQKLASLPDDTLLLPGHNYSEVPHATMAETKKMNPYMRIKDLEGWRHFFPE